MPYTSAAAKTTAAQYPRSQDFLEVPICVENVSSYCEFHVSEMTEWEFLTEVVEQADCGILLDVNNIYVSTKTTISIRTITSKTFRMSGWGRFISRGIRNSRNICWIHTIIRIDPVWKMYGRAIELCGVTNTLLEWDAAYSVV